MKARGFLQIVPERNSQGRARSLSIQRITQRAPRDPLPGAIIVEVGIDIPDEIASVQTVSAAVKAGACMIVIGPPENPGA